MFSTDHLTDREPQGCSDGVEAWLQHLPQAVKERIRAVNRYRNVIGEPIKVGVFRHQGRRIAVSYRPKRVRKDVHDRDRALTKL